MSHKATDISRVLGAPGQTFRGSAMTRADWGAEYRHAAKVTPEEWRQWERERAIKLIRATPTSRQA